MQADIAYMFEFNNFKYFLLVVDCFSSKIFTVPLKNKDSGSVCKAFQIILEQFQAQVYEIQTDKGKEFLGPCKKLFLEKNIVYRTKIGRNKANFAEYYIYLVKKKLYMLLRGILSQDWPTHLVEVTKALNNTPIKKLGWLKPNSIQSEIDSQRVRTAKNIHQISTFTEPSFQVQEANQTAYEKSSNTFQVKDYVYLDFDEKLFDKSFDVSVRKVFHFAYFLKTALKNWICFPSYFPYINFAFLSRTLVKTYIVKVAKFLQIFFVLSAEEIFPLIFLSR